MQPDRSEYGNRRPYGDRSSRPWGDYDHRREERHEPHRDAPKEPHRKYGGHGGREKTSRGREYGDSPTTPYGKGSSIRDARTSSTRRRASSPEWGAFEVKRPRFAEVDRDDRGYRLEDEDDADGPSPDCFSRAHKDFKQTPPQEEDFKYRKTPQDSRHKYAQEEFTSRQQHDDARQSAGYFKDRAAGERSRDGSQERKRSPGRSQSYVKPKLRSDGPAADQDHRQHVARVPLKDPCGPADQSPAAPVQKSAVGFQRFLNVLNKGVNVAALTKIVTQTSAGDRPRSTASFASADHPWAAGFAGGRQVSRQSAGHWSEGDGSQRPAAPPPPPPPQRRRGRSVSPTGRSPPDDTSLQRADAERRSLGADGRSGSPSAETRPTPEDEHKRRQMQDVLQAIGMNFGSEELGQMSDRIQERLYGKKESDGPRKRSGERDARRAFSPTPHSRSSSSSRSSFSPLNREYYKKKESHGAPGDTSAVRPYEGVDYGRSGALQEGAARGPPSEESAAAAARQPSSPSAAYAFFTPAYSPGICPSYPPPPANLPHLGPGLYFPASFPYPRGPPASVYPAVEAQTRRLLPQSAGGAPSLHKYKPLCRPRCLQVIETKQPA